MCKIITRQIINCKNELNKSIKHEKKNKIGTPSKEIWYNDCFMVQRFYNWEENVEPKNLFGLTDIYDTLYLPEEFCKRQILICRHTYDEIDQGWFCDGKLVDCQLEFKLKVVKEMEFQK